MINTITTSRTASVPLWAIQYSHIAFTNEISSNLPYTSIIVTALLSLACSSLGMALKHYKDQYAQVIFDVNVYYILSFNTIYGIKYGIKLVY